MSIPFTHTPDNDTLAAIDQSRGDMSRAVWAQRAIMWMLGQRDFGSNRYRGTVTEHPDGTLAITIEERGDHEDSQ